MSVTARGGYQIVDFKNIPVPQGAANAAPCDPAILDQLNGIGKKPVVVYNLVLSFTAGGSSVYLPVFISNASYDPEHGAEIQLDNGQTVVMILPNGTAFCELN